MPDGEALARQFLYGKRYFLDKFGVDVKVGWNPDTFGHSWQMPQILRRAGLDSYVFGRCAPGPDPTHFFWWEGLDGSRVLGYVPAGWYNVGLQNGTRPILEAARKNTDIRDFMLLYGAGDHGGGPRDADLAAIRKFGENPNEPRLVFDLPEAYLRGIAAANGPGLPVVKRELNFTFPACYTTQSAAKKANRQLESLLVTAEKFSAIAAASGYRDYYPERDIDEAWKIVLRNQFHDILDGSTHRPRLRRGGRILPAGADAGRAGARLFARDDLQRDRHARRGFPGRRLQSAPLGADRAGLRRRRRPAGREDRRSRGPARCA